MHIGIVCPSKIKSSGNPSSEVIKRAKVEARLRVATKTPKKKSKTFVELSNDKEVVLQKLSLEILYNLSKEDKSLSYRTTNSKEDANTCKRLDDS
ncbi:hypothetical protein B0A54_05169 [Friedmanniomyces endolithicus]|uniref:Uncharacterized protein n=1 Tax=Friedmanniomyces endolithicus TaxID=329885 RepID=A0A4U0V948_9PEZI|nr:hypothetical protein B0A54_05169 [Friedmanniomyces endolithicus]